MVKKKFSNIDLIIVLTLTVLCVISFMEPLLNNIIRSLLGLSLIVFLSGYVLIAVLFPRKDDLGIFERLVFTVILSIAITVLTGLVLNYTPWGINIGSLLFSLAGITVFLCAATFWRRKRIPNEDQLRYDFGKYFNTMKTGFSQESKAGKCLSIILIFTIILALSSTAYVIAKPKQNDSYTQFYVLGPDGKINNYPTSLISGQQGNLIIGIVNHENKQTSYRLLVTSNDVVQIDKVVTLNDKQKMEIPFTFTAGDPGTRKLEFLLYKLPDNNNAYRNLHIWLNITGVPELG
ncbi:MAG: DUF1616 domain-containing protein [Methanobacterium sp.]|nr:DUF1616 domain-containing protein [Methanobacterium sp.]